MTIRFDHIQLARSEQLILGSALSEEIYYYPAIYTDQVAFRTYINPGFNGTLEWMHAHLAFAVLGTATANVLTSKWQIRTRTETAFVTVKTNLNLNLSETKQIVDSMFVYDAAAGSNETPFELQLVFSNNAAQGMTFYFGNTTLGGMSSPLRLAVRCVGESV
jgi:hypothetical protein